MGKAFITCVKDDGVAAYELPGDLVKYKISYAAGGLFRPRRHDIVNDYGSTPSDVFIHNLAERSSVNLGRPDDRFDVFDPSKLELVVHDRPFTGDSDDLPSAEFVSVRYEKVDGHYVIRAEYKAPSWSYPSDRYWHLDALSAALDGGDLPYFLSQVTANPTYFRATLYYKNQKVRWR